MYDPSRIIFGFDDLAIMPQMRVTDRKMKVDRDIIRQKCGKSRFLICLKNEKDIMESASDKTNYYIADVDDLALKLLILKDASFANIIPIFNIKELLNEKGLILQELSESKDRFNIILDVGENISALFDLRSVENAEYLKLFRVIYRVYSNSQIIGMLIDLNAVGIIVDRTFSNLMSVTKATNIADTSTSISAILGDGRRNYDLFENFRDRNLHVLSEYDAKDPYAFKSFALGAQFIIIDNMPVAEARLLVNTCETELVHVMESFNCGTFNEFYASMSCGLVSKN